MSIFLLDGCFRTDRTEGKLLRRSFAESSVVRVEGVPARGRGGLLVRVGIVRVDVGLSFKLAVTTFVASGNEESSKDTALLVTRDGGGLQVGVGAGVVDVALFFGMGATAMVAGTSAEEDSVRFG